MGLFIKVLFGLTGVICILLLIYSVGYAAIQYRREKMAAKKEKINCKCHSGWDKKSSHESYKGKSFRKRYS